MTGLQCTLSSDQKGYDLKLDLRYDEQGKIKQGIFLGETTPQNQAFILVAHKGEFKENPTIGVGMADILNDHDFTYWKRLITIEFERDGQHIDKLELNNQGLTIEAHY